MLRRCLGFLLVLAACNNPKQDANDTSKKASADASSTAAGFLADPAAVAAVGKPAPDFTLQDLDGKSHKLSDLRGKTVVLEWFNPQCPFVKKAHTVGSLKDYAKTATSKGVVWLAVNSGGPGKQGHGTDANKKGVSEFAMDHPVLLDESGAVGRAYGATNTPHMYVIDPQGVLVYRGAIDNSPDAEGLSPTDGKLVQYVDQALAELAASKPVSVAETKAYGCTVKY